VKHKKSEKKKSDTLVGRSETLKMSCLEKETKVRRLLLTKKPLYLYYKNTYFVADNSNKIPTPASVEFLLQESKDVFPKEVPNGFPP